MDYINRYAFIISKICDRTIPGKKMIQKLMYLIERKGVDLQLNYSIHFFGPYSSTLDRAIHSMEMKDIINIDTSGITHEIRMGSAKTIDANFNKSEKETIGFVLDHFSVKTANELEALTTLDYVATEILKGIGTDDEIINEVKRIKGNKYKVEYLERELGILKEFGFID